MASYDVGEVLEASMGIPTFISLWPRIHKCYKDLGFTDPMTDGQRIDEYKYVSDQLGKYVGTHWEEFLSYEDNLPKLVEMIEDQMRKPGMTPNDRKKIVYCMLRDEWLYDLWQLVLTLEKQEEEEDV